MEAKARKRSRAARPDACPTFPFPSFFDLLPSEVAALVFANLELSDLLNVSLCSKALRTDVASHLQALRLPPHNFEFIPTYSTRLKRAQRTGAGGGHGPPALGSWPLPQASFPSLFSHFPAIASLSMELDMRQQGLRVGRVDALLASLRSISSMPAASGASSSSSSGPAAPCLRLTTLKVHLRASVSAGNAGKPILKHLLKGLQSISQGCPTLTRLELRADMMPQYSHLTALTMMTSLRTLTISRVEPQALGLIASLTQLTELEVGCTSPGRHAENDMTPALQGLSSLVQLASFSLEASEVSRLNQSEEQALCHALSAMQSLTRLALVEVSIRSDSWAAVPLELLQRLQVLSLPGPLLPGFGSFEFVPPAVTQDETLRTGISETGLTLPSLATLTTTFLEYFCARNQGEGLSQFVFTPALTSLECRMCALESSFSLAAQLGGMHLVRLHVTLPTLRTPLSAITHLSALRALEDFALRDNQIGGSGSPDLRVSYVGVLLAAWTRLRRLELVGKADMMGPGQAQGPAPALTLASARRHLARLRSLPLQHLAIRLPRLPLEVLPSCLTSLELCGLAAPPPHSLSASSRARTPEVAAGTSAAAGSSQAGDGQGTGEAGADANGAGADAREEEAGPVRMATRSRRNAADVAAAAAAAAASTSGGASASAAAAAAAGTRARGGRRRKGSGKRTAAARAATAAAAGGEGAGGEGGSGAAASSSAAVCMPGLPRLVRLRVSMPEWCIVKSSTELRSSFAALVPLMQHSGETLELSRWALTKDQYSSLQLFDYVSVIAERLPGLRRLQLVQVANWWDKIDCSQLKPLSTLSALTHVGLQEPGRRWGVRVRNLTELSSLRSLAQLVTGIESAPGASRLVLHSMSPQQRRDVLAWAQSAQDSQAGSCLW